MSPIQLTPRFTAYPPRSKRGNPAILAIYEHLPPMLSCTMGTKKRVPEKQKKCRTDTNMKIRNFLLPLCLVLMLAVAIPAIAAADDAQVTVTPTDTIAPVDTVAPAAAPGFDPLGSLAGIFGLRQDIHADRASDKNLTEGIQDNRQEIHQNWWDNFNIFKNILGNREQVRSDQALDLSNRTADNGLRQDIHTDRVDLRQDPGNASAYRADIGTSRGDIQDNRQDIALNHEDIHDERNASQQDRAAIQETRQTDIQLRQTNAASWQDVHQNREDIRTDRQDIRNDRGAKGSAS